MLSDYEKTPRRETSAKKGKENMKLVIMDHYDKDKVIDNPQFIPTIGSMVAWYYSPAPRVVEIVYDYDDNIIFVKVA